MRAGFLAAVALALTSAACGPSEQAACGPTSGTVDRVVDGDTIELTSGEKVRYLMVDTPESTTQHECWGEEAKQANRELVLGQTVTIRYDQECSDRYGRLLGYVSLNGREINSLLIERGHACVLHIPPNGDDRVAEFRALQSKARAEGRGLWAACEQDPPCR